MRLRLRFQPIGGDSVEIQAEGFPPHTVAAKAFADLATDQVQNDDPAALRDLGRRLYALLDGKERRLAELAPNDTLELCFATLKRNQPSQQAHLPWELLHDGEAFLVQKGILPVRLMEFGPQSSRIAQQTGGEPANRPLNVLFMACSPRNVHPVLNFEAEERIILDATAKQPLYLVPEESGSVEELEDTVRDNQPFDVFHVTGHGDLYDGDKLKAYPALHGVQPSKGQPVLLTEDSAGRCVLATAEDLQRAFTDRVPRLVFLSGCRTGELPEQTGTAAAHASFAQALLSQGFPNVMGWAQPVYDTSATVAAALLYRQLSSGATMEQALRYTLQEMTRPGDQKPFQIPDWHLLRLFTKGKESQSALVTEQNRSGRTPYQPSRRAEGFLDQAGQVKVAGEGFVGRRRAIQRTLPALDANSGRTGVVIWGLGGQGKSSLAERLCGRVERRRPKFRRRVVLQGLLNESRIVALLKAKHADHEGALEALSSQALQWNGRLLRFFRAIAGEPILLVLDDFESGNIERQGERLSLAREASDWLTALDGAIRESGTESRIVITSRYWSAESFPTLGLLAEQLPQMDSMELRKVVRNEGSVESPAAAERAIGGCDGNPRLFKRLAHEEAPEQQQQIVEEFRAELEIGELLDELIPAEKRELARLSVFQIAVPLTLAVEVSGSREHVSAVSRGLAVISESAEEGGEPEIVVAALVRPLLETMLQDDEWESCYATAARAAHQLWWQGRSSVPEEKVLEIVRLAMLGGEREIACDGMEGVARNWNRRGRYRDTVRWGRLVLSRFEDLRVLSSLAIAERVLGETDAALQHLERARALQTDGDAAETALTLYETAILRAQQGKVEEAVELYRQSLEISERIGNAQGKAATLHNMAGLRAQQGEVEEAVELYRQSLEISERIGNAQGKAATLHQMAGLRAQQGEVEEAVELYRQSLEIKERIGNAQGKAATLANMAAMVFQSGNAEQATGLLAEAAQVLGRIRAWPDLLLVLANLSAADQEHREHWLAQSCWLACVLPHPGSVAIQVCELLFHRIPNGDALELPLAGWTFLRVAGEAEGARAKLREQAAKLLAIAAQNRGLNPEALNTWLQERARNPGELFREVLHLLEAMVAGEWIFDRQSVIASLAGGVASSEKAEGTSAGHD